MTSATSSPAEMPRHIQPELAACLRDTRIIALVGPRQAGKTTLARSVARQQGMHFVTLDDAQYRQFAQADPLGFIRNADRLVIDEIQRAPALLLALKQVVDEDARPGRFLITGSVELFRGTVAPDSLAGRVATLELLPFSQAELAGQGPSSFLHHAFNAHFPALGELTDASRIEERVLAGGYPEALSRSSVQRRQKWLLDYSHALMTRDVAELSGTVRNQDFPRLLEHAALLAGQTFTLASLAQALSVDGKTIARWLDILEQLFVLRRLPAWHSNEFKRLTKAPKLHFLDSGLLAAQRGISAITSPRDRERFGALLEGFVYTELRKQAAAQGMPLRIYHYRDRDQVEVALVLERPGAVLGIEVKAAASVRPEDFKGLRRLQAAVGKAFASGLILYDGSRIQQVGERLFALPLPLLWADELPA